MLGNMLNDLAEAIRRWTEKKHVERPGGSHEGVGRKKIIRFFPWPLILLGHVSDNTYEKFLHFASNLLQLALSNLPTSNISLEVRSDL